jgi:PTH2 family peptidyl-tRNA hydrolase
VPHKLVVCVRTDLDMGQGKLAAQVGHASVTAALDAESADAKTFQAWKREGQAKVVVGVGSVDELEQVERDARDAGLRVTTVTDAGRTQLDPGTTTCLAVGPDEAGKLDPVTGHLSLL